MTTMRKKNNVDEILVKFPKRETNSSCIFPEKYNETITINCTISDLKDIDPYNEGFKYANSLHIIRLTYSKLDVSNFINANKTLPEHKVFTEFDKSKKLCSDNRPSPSPLSSPSPSPSSSSSPSPSDDKMTLNYQNKKNSLRLSAGGIIAITIPSTLVLLGVAGFTLKESSSIPTPIIYNTSEMQNATFQNLSLSPYEIQQSVQVVQPVEKVQVVQQVQDVNIVQ